MSRNPRAGKKNVCQKGNDCLDWDEHIAKAPLRPCGTIYVKLERKGKSKPTPVKS
jgi:hypothetical protein